VGDRLTVIDDQTEFLGRHLCGRDAQVNTGLTVGTMKAYVLKTFTTHI